MKKSYQLDFYTLKCEHLFTSFSKIGKLKVYFNVFCSLLYVLNSFLVQGLTQRFLSTWCEIAGVTWCPRTPSSWMWFTLTAACSASTALWVTWTSTLTAACPSSRDVVFTSYCACACFGTTVSMSARAKQAERIAQIDGLFADFFQNIPSA